MSSMPLNWHSKFQSQNYRDVIKGHQSANFRVQNSALIIAIHWRNPQLYSISRSYKPGSLCRDTIPSKGLEEITLIINLKSTSKVTMVILKTLLALTAVSAATVCTVCLLPSLLKESCVPFGKPVSESSDWCVDCFLLKFVCTFKNSTSFDDVPVLCEKSLLQCLQALSNWYVFHEGTMFHFWKFDVPADRQNSKCNRVHQATRAIERNQFRGVEEEILEVCSLKF